MKKLLLAFVACAAMGVGYAELVNQISFNDNTDLLKASVGERGVAYKVPSKNTCEIDTSNNGLGALTPVANGSFLTNVVGGGAITIPQGAFLSIPHGVSEDKARNWCLVMRFNPPEQGDWYYGLLSLDMENSGDAYLFMGRNNPGFGGGTGGWGDGYTETSIHSGLFNRWNTLVLSVVDGMASLYVNGEYVRTTITDKFSLAGKPRIYIGADNDGEDHLFHLDYVRIYDESKPSDIFRGGDDRLVGDDFADVLPASAAESGSLLAGGHGFTYTLDGAYELYKWEGPDSTGEFTIPEGGASVDVLMVGGGGAGGMVRGGGGGGGGFIEQTINLAAGTYTVKVGAGGLPQIPTVTGGGDNNMSALKQGKTPDSACGGDSVISLNATPVLTAVGGGGGGNFNYSNNDVINSAGLDGGSGGGAAGESTGGAVGGEGTTDQGSAGGKSAVNLAGGGGGAGANGRTGGSGANGDGGAGKASEISGSLVYYAGGGGAGGYADAGTAGVGGEGGGGDGSVQKVGWSATAGADGFGGGGGGGSGTSNNANYEGGARGGSGIVYVRFLMAGMVGVSCSCDNSKARELSVTARVNASDDDPADKFDVYAAIGATKDSADEFTQVGEGVGIDVDCTTVFGGLDAGADYVVAVKAQNRKTGKWSDVVYSSVKTSTLVYPVVAFGPGIVKSGDGYEVSLAVSGIQDGVTEIKATLNGVEKTVAGTGMYSWQVPADSNGCSASVELSYLARGVAFSQVFSASVSGEGRIAMESTLVGHDTADTAFVMNVGDKIILPEPEGGAKYVNLSGHRFLGLDGNTVVAREPGIGAVEQYDTDGQLLSTAVMLVKPTDMQEGGKTFVFDYGKSSNGKWDDAGAWYCVETGDYTLMPDSVKDVAFVIIPSAKKAFYLKKTGVSTVQDIYFGRPVNVKGEAVRVTGPGMLTVAGIQTKTYTRPGKFMICSCLTGDQLWEFYMTPWNESEKWTLDVSDNDVEIDLGGPANKFYPTKNTKTNQVMLRFDRYIDIAIAKGRKITLVNDTDRSGARPGGDGQLGNDAVHFLTSSDSVSGEGVFEIRLAGVVNYGGNFFKSFQGEIVGSVRNFVSGYVGRDGGAFASETGNFYSDATMTLAGYLNGFDITKSVGTFSHGANHGWTNPGSQTDNGIPSAGFKLNGGYMRFYNYNKTLTEFRPTTFAGKDDYEAFYETEKLTVAGGLSEIDLNVNPPDNNPIIHLHAKSIGHEDSGSVFIYDARTWKNNTSLREMAELDGFAEHFVGNTTTVDEENDVFPIVPWMVARWSTDWDTGDLWWAHVGSDNVMCRGGVRTNKKLTEVDSPLRNVYCSGNGVALTDDVTVNSLVLEGQGKEKRLGEGRTLTITSGGLVIKNSDNGFGTATTVAQNGSVIFPNRAYVWAASGDAVWPDVIWSPMTAPNGFCAAGIGQLRIGGDQTGIDGDITVNNGTLQLGDTSGHGCTLDVPINLVGGNTKLVVNQQKTLDDITLNLSCPGGYGPKITVPAAGERCYKVYVDGESLPRGVYGAIGSGAPLECEYIAEGSGFLTVRKDDSAIGFSIFVK